METQVFQIRHYRDRGGLATAQAIFELITASNYSLDALQSDAIHQLVRANKPVHLILPALPSGDEALALKLLNGLCTDIGERYIHGAFMTVCPDGRLLSELTEVSDQAINDYNRGIRAIIRENQLNSLFTYGLEDAFVNSSNFNEMRALLVKDYAAPKSEAWNKLLEDTFPDAIILKNPVVRSQDSRGRDGRSRATPSTQRDSKTN